MKVYETFLFLFSFIPPESTTAPANPAAVAMASDLISSRLAIEDPSLNRSDCNSSSSFLASRNSSPGGLSCVKSGISRRGHRCGSGRKPKFRRPISPCCRKSTEEEAEKLALVGEMEQFGCLTLRGGSMNRRHTLPCNQPLLNPAVDLHRLLVGTLS